MNWSRGGVAQNTTQCDLRSATAASVLCPGNPGPFGARGQNHRVPPPARCCTSPLRDFQRTGETVHCLVDSTKPSFQPKTFSERFQPKNGNSYFQSSRSLGRPGFFLGIQCMAFPTLKATTQVWVWWWVMRKMAPPPGDVVYCWIEGHSCPPPEWCFLLLLTGSKWMLSMSTAD